MNYGTVWCACTLLEFFHYFILLVLYISEVNICTPLHTVCLKAKCFADDFAYKNLKYEALL